MWHSQIRKTTIRFVVQRGSNIGHALKGFEVWPALSLSSARVMERAVNVGIG